MPTISIIIPIYNSADYLAQCLDSLIAQTFVNWEALLIDDASSDDSARIAQAYTARDHRFLFVQLPYNQGQSVARNLGLDQAKGEYIAFVDSDDWLDNDFLTRHISAIKGYDMVQSGYRRVKNSVVLQQKMPIHPWQFTVAWMRLYRSDFIAGLRFEERTYYEDILWSVDILLQHPHIRLIPYIGYNYRLNPQSTTAISHDEHKEKVLTLLRNRKKSAIVFYTLLKLRVYWLLKK